MDGYTLDRRVRELLQETSTGTFMNSRTTYDCIYDAVKDFNKKTHYLTNTQSITVSASTATYNLNPDFVALAYRDRYNKPFIKYTVSSVDYFIYPREYADVLLENNSSTASVPSSFSITDASQVSRATGTATSAGAASNGECTLTDTGADFSDIAVGDLVHNTTDGSHGVVIATTSSTALLCALFEGTNNAWAENDAYIVVPQARYSITFDPTPSASATATIYYVQCPDPVYSPYRAYKLPTDAELPISQFAAFLYKYRDMEPNFGDKLYEHYDMFTRKASLEYRRGIPDKAAFRVNLNKSNKLSTGIGSWR